MLPKCTKTHTLSQSGLLCHGFPEEKKGHRSSTDHVEWDLSMAVSDKKSKSDKWNQTLGDLTAPTAIKAHTHTYIKFTAEIKTLC